MNKKFKGAKKSSNNWFVRTANIIEIVAADSIVLVLLALIFFVFNDIQHINKNKTNPIIPISVIMERGKLCE